MLQPARAHSPALASAETTPTDPPTANATLGEQLKALVEDLQSAETTGPAIATLIERVNWREAKAGNIAAALVLIAGDITNKPLLESWLRDEHELMCPCCRRRAAQEAA